MRWSRWISSMKRTSPSSRLVRIAARSPERSSAGPLVTLLMRALGGPDAGRATEPPAALVGPVAEPLEGGPPLGRGAGPAVDSRWIGRVGAELGGQLDHEPLRRALPDAGHEREG